MQQLVSITIPYILQVLVLVTNEGHLPTHLSVQSNNGGSLSLSQGQYSSDAHTVLTTYSSKTELGKIWLKLLARFMANAAFFLVSSPHFSLSHLPITGYAICLSHPFFPFLLENCPEDWPFPIWISFISVIVHDSSIEVVSLKWFLLIQTYSHCIFPGVTQTWGSLKSNFFYNFIIYNPHSFLSIVPLVSCLLGDKLLRQINHVSTGEPCCICMHQVLQCCLYMCVSAHACDLLFLIFNHSLITLLLYR